MGDRGTCSFDVLDGRAWPKIQSHATGLELAMLSGTNSIQFQDHIGLQTELAEETIATAGMEALVVEGLEHIKMLYTFRSVGRSASGKQFEYRE